MSQHTYRNLSRTGIWVEVDMGWDRDEQSLFCTVRPLEDAQLGEALYSMADDPGAEPTDLNHVLRQLRDRFSIILPEEMVLNILRDVLNNYQVPQKVY